MNNSRKTSKPRQLEGNGWQQMTQIVQFHETRLNRIDNYIKSKEMTKQELNNEDSGDLEQRVETLEEHSIIVTNTMEKNSKSLSDFSTDFAKAMTKSNKESAEQKKLATATRTFPTKLAVMTEKFRLLEEKVEELMNKLETLETKSDNKKSNNITLDIEENDESEDEEKLEQ